MSGAKPRSSSPARKVSATMDAKLKALEAESASSDGSPVREQIRMLGHLSVDERKAVARGVQPRVCTSHSSNNFIEYAAAAQTSRGQSTQTVHAREQLTFATMTFDALNVDTKLSTLSEMIFDREWLPTAGERLLQPFSYSGSVPVAAQAFLRTTTET